MSIILGIDVGGSTTKIVGFQSDKSLVDTVQVKAGDQITSMYGAIGSFLRKARLSLKEVSKIVLTGVGASYFQEDIYDIPTVKMEEFQAIGYGGLKLSGLTDALVISMGTGTAYVRAGKDGMKHIGGSGVGGGTLMGLASRLVKENDFSVITDLASKGNLQKVDLSIQDISNAIIPSLPPHATASNFGKIENTADSADFALGLLNMLYQTVGMLAVFACLDTPVKDIVLTGSLAHVPQAKTVFNELSHMHSVNFIIPHNAVFATAIGATVPYL